MLKYVFKRIPMQNVQVFSAFRHCDQDILSSCPHGTLGTSPQATVHLNTISGLSENYPQSISNLILSSVSSQAKYQYPRKYTVSLYPKPFSHRLCKSCVTIRQKGIALPALLSLKQVPSKERTVALSSACQKPDNLS